MVLIYSPTSKEMKNLGELRKELKEQDEVRKISGFDHFYFFLKKQLTVTFIMLCMHLQSPPVETIVRSSEDGVSKTGISKRDKEREDSTCALQPQPLSTGHSSLVFSFPEKHLLGHSQVLF